MFPRLESCKEREVIFNPAPWNVALGGAIEKQLKLGSHLSLEELFTDSDYKELPSALPDYLTMSPDKFTHKEILKIAALEFSIFKTRLNEEGKRSLRLSPHKFTPYSLHNFVDPMSVRLPCLRFPGPPLTDLGEITIYKLTPLLAKGSDAMRWLRANAAYVASFPSIPAPLELTTDVDAEVQKMTVGWLKCTDTAKFNQAVLSDIMKYVPNETKKIERHLDDVRKTARISIRNAPFFDELKKFMETSPVGAPKPFRLQTLRAAVIESAVAHDTALSIYECAPCLSRTVIESLSWKQPDFEYMEMDDDEEKKRNIAERAFFLSNTQCLNQFNLRVTLIAEEIVRKRLRAEEQKTFERNAEILTIRENRDKLVYKFNEVYRPALEQSLACILELYPSDYMFTPNESMLRKFYAETQFKPNCPYMPSFLKPVALNLGDIADLEASFFKGMKVSVSDYFKLYFIMLK